NDIRGAERARDAIEATMPKVVGLRQGTGTAYDAFIQSFLIILREGFEAILVIGAVVAFLLKTGHRERLRDIWTGVALGLVARAGKRRSSIKPFSTRVRTLHCRSRSASCSASPRSS